MKKFSTLLVVLLLMLASFTAGVEYQRGDVDQNGQVGISDVTCLIDYLLNGTWPDEPVSPDEHEYVDLGLPSGTLWATCNVGANVPEEYGYYLAWGETEPKDYYNWSNYKWCNGDMSTLTKYCNDSTYGYNGFVDNKDELDPEDDAAYVNWGPSWRMPTFYQLSELYQYCSSVLTSINGVGGRLFTAPNGNSLFLPAADARSHYRLGGSIYDEGPYGFYWSRTLFSDGPINAFILYFCLDDMYSAGDDRRVGHSVRAVRVP